MQERLSENAVIACDDGIVAKFSQKWGVQACLLWLSGPLDVEATLAPIDVLESSSLVAGLYLMLTQRNGVRPRAILLDSLTTLGFSVVSPSTLYKLLETPVVVVYKYRPRLERLTTALKKHFVDWSLRASVLKLLERTVRVETKKGELYLITWGIEIEEARKLVEELQRHSRVPEPLRLVHSIASELTRLVLRSELSS
ncbi:MAG: DUF99 family protein [Acidilobaceae archaeon]